MSPREELAATCHHPDSEQVLAEAWGPLGPFLGCVRCRLCGTEL